MFQHTEGNNTVMFNYIEDSLGLYPSLSLCLSDFSQNTPEKHTGADTTYHFLQRD